MATGTTYSTTGAGGAARFSSGTKSGAVSEKEDLANFISMITRDETPFMSSIGKTKATGVYHEWQTDKLNEPTNSRLSQGADFGDVPPDGTGGNLSAIERFRTRLGNYTQINGKTVSVSGTKRAVDQAGVADEYAYQLKKRGTELRRDVERDLVHSVNVATSGSGVTAGSLGGMAAWINTAETCIYGTGFAAPATADQGVGTTAYTLAAADNTGSDLALSQIDEVMQKIYEAGGKAGRAMTSPKNRRIFSAQAQAGGVADSSGNVRRNIDADGKLRQSVDIYMSDFGDVAIEANYIMGLTNSVTLNATATNLANRVMWVYDPSWFKIATLRPLKEVDVGQRGDSTVGMILEELTLECSNPRGAGAIIGLKA